MIISGHRDFDILAIMIIFGLMVYVASVGAEKAEAEWVAVSLGENMMKLPRPIMMVLMAIPEQTVLQLLEPDLPIHQRLAVSIAMYVIHFSWNGLVMKPKRSYNELPWIIGTAYFAYLAIGVKQETAVALVAADSVMTLSLRGLGAK